MKRTFRDQITRPDVPEDFKRLIVDLARRRSKRELGTVLWAYAKAWEKKLSPAPSDATDDFDTNQAQGR